MKILAKRSANLARLQIHSIPTKTENLNLAGNQTSATIKNSRKFH